MKIRYFFLITMTFLSFHVTAQEEFMKSLRKLLESKGLGGAGCGVSVIESGTGKSLLKINENTALIPASVLKTVTTSTALEVLGENYTFETFLGYSGIPDSVSGLLKGDLIVKGGGDPTLGSEYFRDLKNDTDFVDKWLFEIQRKGIKSIDGNLVVDASVYEDEDIPGTWVWEDLGNYYGAGAGGITVYDNLFRVVFKSGAAGELTRIIKIVPEIPSLEIKNEVRASKINGDNTNVFGSPWGGKRIIRGTIPENRDEFAIKATLTEPARFLGEWLKSKLTGIGITISGQVLVQKTDSAGFSAIYLQKSPPLSEIVKELNHESINLFAEQLLKHIAYKQTGTGSVSEGTAFITGFWKSKGLDVTGMFQEDGSGLSHFNAITPAQVTWILNFMKNQSSASATFFNSLPTAGKGTLTVFNPADFPDECLKAKSGSMTRVRVMQVICVLSQEKNWFLPLFSIIFQSV